MNFMIIVKSTRKGKIAVSPQLLRVFVEATELRVEGRVAHAVIGFGGNVIHEVLPVIT
jgi:hypothetical protein